MYTYDHEEGTDLAANALAADGIGSKRMLSHKFVSTDSGWLCHILFHFTHSHTYRGKGQMLA